MLKEIKLLNSLPAFGPMPLSFPPEWGRSGREGVVVEIQTDKEKWIANFKPGILGKDLA